LSKELHPFFRLYSGRRRLTVQEKESIIDAVIARTAPSKQRSIWEHFRTSAAMRAVVIAGCLLLAAPLVLLIGNKSPIENEFSAKGGSAKPRFDVLCSEAKREHTCFKGNTLMFKVFPPDGQPWFGAFGKHTGTSLIVWYFPAREKDALISLAGKRIGDFLKDGVVVGDEHSAGDYEIFGVFSSYPIKRADVRKLFENGVVTSDKEYTILKAKMQIR
jgi:hypothetical protein